MIGNRTLETLTKLTRNGTQKQKKFSYDTNNLNQYLDRSIYVDIDEIIEETNTGAIETLTGSGTIEVISTEIITEEEFIQEEPIVVEEVLIEEEIELEGKLLYDNNGNLVGNNLNNKRQYIYSYDYKNRLVQIEKNIYKKVNNSETDEIEYKQKIVQIKYDVLGRRIEKKFNNNSYRKYYYSNQDIILEENYSKKDKLKNSKEFIYSNSLDDILSMKLVEYKTRKIKEEYVNKNGVTKTRKIKEQYVETNNYFYQKDHLGSIIAITDETGTIVEEYSYDIFGKPYTKKSDGTIAKLKKSPIGNTRMYTGREYDRGLKLYYNRARYYNPQLGRFISRDPIDIADDVNLYAYVGNNSVMFVDRKGTDKSNFREKLYNSIQDKIDYTQLMMIETGVYGMTHGANIYSEVVGLVNDGSEYFGKPLDLQNGDVTSYMLSHAVFGYGSDMYISNEHFIGKELQTTSFYNDAINDAINRSRNGVIDVYVTGETVSDSWDFSNGFGTINYSVTGKINGDGSIETNFQIVDLYKFYDLGDDTLVHNNIAWISQQNNLSVTPYTYTVDIYNIIK